MSSSISSVEGLPRGRHRQRLAVIERLLHGPEVAVVLEGHPLPDLIGATPVEIAVALAEAIVEAHADVLLAPPLDEAPQFRLCPECRVTVERASRIAELGAIPNAWPNPLFAVFDAVRG